MKRLTALVTVPAALLAVAACSSPDGNARVGADVGLSEPNAFEVVSRSMVYHCGSLDCHGTPYRNLRLFGYGGLRLRATDTPEGASTTDDELTANYQAIAGLEPELFRQVVDEGGREPQRLLLVAKPRQLQSHKGGTVMNSGDQVDTCITSWLAKSIKREECESSVDPTASIPLRDAGH